MNVFPQMPDTYPVACHTDYVGLGSTFVAIKGHEHDGTNFIARAIEKGATRVVVAHDVKIPEYVQQLLKRKNIDLMRVDNTRKALAHLSAQAAGNPVQKLSIVGITGTKGKTITAFVLAHILQQAGYKTALMSTIKNSINGHDFSAPLTTAQPDYLHQFLKLCVDQEVDYVVMEVAAQALTLHRVNGIQFDGVIFTNFGLEHLEFYQSMDDYFTAKCQILEHRKAGAPALINIDDTWCAQLVGRYQDVVTFGCKGAGNFSMRIDSDVSQQVTFTLNWPEGKYQFACPQLIGLFNVYNIAAAVSMAIKLGILPQQIAQALQVFVGVPGRLQRYKLPNGATCIIDYAHNPMSYHALLSELRKLSDHVIVVFGSGGERDASRRPRMGTIAAQYADVIVLTSDNPRTEDPRDIIDDIVSGISAKHKQKIVYEIDRAKAIYKAYAVSKSGSIIALLGKGPDEYQIIGKVKKKFSEKEIIQSLGKVKHC